MPPLDWRVQRARTPNVGLDDGLFEVCLVRASSQCSGIQQIFNDLVTAPIGWCCLIGSKRRVVRVSADERFRGRWTASLGARRDRQISDRHQALHNFEAAQNKIGRCKSKRLREIFLRQAILVRD